jgi:hypothetical protein
MSRISPVQLGASVRKFNLNRPFICSTLPPLDSRYELMTRGNIMTISIGIIDEPVAPGATDNLDINIHSKSLIDFITDTSTPITVGIQGEWGSGKTSLINSIHHAFESQDTVKQIWINSWEYSLLSTPEEALLKIVNRIIDELLESDTDVNRKAAIKEGAGKIFRGALRVGAQVALGSEAAKVASELLDSSGQSIAALRQQLTSLVQDIANRSSNPYKKIIVYVDDLDRIEPRNAVAILELLKNIFSVPNCVFILAIDYQVVVKGLEHKFGKQTPENEWEFRAFFDKIIQLPFMMPMGQYNIGKYVNSLLIGIGFVEGEGLDDKAIREIVLRTIGGNPRSIKRLANSVSLIQIFVKNKKEMSKEEDIVDGEEEGISSEDEKFLLFALLCLQIAYPTIYSLLIQEPDFPKWDDALAFKETNRSEERSGDNERLSPDEMKKIFDIEFEAAKKSDDFNEDWEQALYRICYGRPRMKPRVADISKFFSYIKDELLSDQQEIIGETVARLLTQTSVTSVTSTDQGQNINQFIKSQPNADISVVSDALLKKDPDFKFKEIHRNYISFQGTGWPEKLEFQIITRKRQKIYIVQIGAEKKSGKPIAEQMSSILELTKSKLPHIEWKIGPWLSDYDNRMFTHVDISDPDKAAEVFLELISNMFNDLDKRVSEIKK